ncbi:MAG: hypothetical protein AABY14_01755 [Nanoarchaeota archaeon]
MFEKRHFVPLTKIELDEGEIVELAVVPIMRFSWRGALKGINAKSVELQHKIKEFW